MNIEYFPAHPNLNLKAFTLLDRYVPAAFSARAKHYYCRYRSRCQLLKLDDERLADIGLSREQMLAEAQLPFWR